MHSLSRYCHVSVARGKQVGARLRGTGATETAVRGCTAPMRRVDVGRAGWRLQITRLEPDPLGARLVEEGHVGELRHVEELEKPHGVPPRERGLAARRVNAPRAGDDLTALVKYDTRGG